MTTNILPPVTTFSELFIGMPDVYNGIYQPYLTEYQPDNPTITQNHNNNNNTEELLHRTATRFPMDQVPSVFMYQDPNTLLLHVIHHIHQVITPLGLPTNPLSNTYLGFYGDVYHGQGQVVQIPTTTFFSTTGDIVVPTLTKLTALLLSTATAASNDGMVVGPFHLGDADTDVINTRRAIPIPHAYVSKVAFRNLMTPREAWQELGETIITDGRQDDCIIVLNFLRAAIVVRDIGNPNPTSSSSSLVYGPPSTVQQPNAPTIPVDGPILEHIHCKLRQLLPAIFIMQSSSPLVTADWYQEVVLFNQTVTDGINSLIEDRKLDRQVASAPKTLSDVFPVHARGIRRLCGIGDNDNNDHALPEFWRFYAQMNNDHNGNKADVMSAFTHLVRQRAYDKDSAQVQSVISTTLYAKISTFALGAMDPDVITQGVSPFLMCPLWYKKAKETTELSQTYMLLMGENNIRVQLADIEHLFPLNDYNIPDDFHELKDFIGAYSVIWDVLVGPDHPLAKALRAHYEFWDHTIRTEWRGFVEAYSEHLMNMVIVGTLRYIQLVVMRYVHEIMFSHDPLLVPLPSFTHVETAIQYRIFQTLPRLPAQYQSTTTPPPTTTPNQMMARRPPVVTTPNTNAPRSRPPRRNQNQSTSATGSTIS